MLYQSRRSGITPVAGNAVCGWQWKEAEHSQTGHGLAHAHVMHIAVGFCSDEI